MRIVSVLFLGTKECAAPTPAQSQNQSLFSWVQDKEKSLSSFLEGRTFPEGNSRTRTTQLHRLNRCAPGELTRGRPPWYNHPLSTRLFHFVRGETDCEGSQGPSSLAVLSLRKP